MNSSDLETHLVYLSGARAADLAALPLQTRILDRLTAIMILADEILGDLQTEDANPILSIETGVRRVNDDAEALIRRLAQ